MPELKRRVASNTTPIIALSVIGKLDLLEKLYGTVLIPPAVAAEIQAGSASVAAGMVVNLPFIKTKSLKDPGRADLLSDLDRGEAEAVVLALELKDSFGDAGHVLIIDERLGRKHASRLGLRITGTLGVLLRAKREGHIPAIKPLTEQLLQGGIYLSEDLVAQVLQMAGE